MSLSRTPGTLSGDGAVTEIAENRTLTDWVWTGRGWGGGLLWASAILSVVGAWAALSAEGPRGDLVDLQHTFQEQRSVDLGLFPQRGAGLLVHRWEELGLSVSHDGTRDPGRRWVWRAAAPDDPAVAAAAAAAGLKMGPTRWNHASLAGIHSSGALAILTDRQSSGSLRTLVFSAKDPAEWGASELDAVDALSKSLPSPRSELRIYGDGTLRLSVPLNDRGAPQLALAVTWDRVRPDSAVRSCVAEGQSDPGLERLEREWKRIESLAEARGLELGVKPGALWVRELAPGNAPHQKAGWYSRKAGRLVMACGVGRAARDAVAAWALSNFCDGLSGEPRLSTDQVGFLAEIEALGPLIRDDDARTGLDAPAELPRAVAVRYGGSVGKSRAAFGTADGAIELNQISALGFGAVCIEVHVPVVSPSNRAGLPVEFDQWAGGRSRPVTLEGDGAVLLAAEHARAAGLKVVLWPRLIIGPSGGLLGHQLVATSEHWLELSGRVRETSALIAAMAQEMGAEGLVLFDHHFLPTKGEADAQGEVAEALAVRSSVRIALLEGAAAFRGPKVCVAGSSKVLSFVQGADEFRAAGVVLGLDRSAGLSGPAGDRKHDFARLSSRFDAARATLGPDLQMIQLSVPGTKWARRGRDPWGGATEPEARRDYLLALIESLKGEDEVPLIVARGWIPGGGPLRGFDVSRWPMAIQRMLAATR